jgi:chemotaxis protein MotB
MAEKNNNQEEPVIIKKIIKKGGHGGHHGGAWKVAYADFVTAMMCLFLLLWLVNVDPSSKAAISQVFKQPISSGPMDGNIFIFGGAKRPTDPGKFDGGASFFEFQQLVVSEANKKEMQKQMQEELKKELETSADPELLEQVQFNQVKNGILIEIKDSDKRQIFEPGSSSLTFEAKTIIDLLAKLLRQRVSPIIVSGHTDSKQYNYANYDNWNLSTDRAIAVKSRLLYGGINNTRFARVEGYADTQLKNPDSPLAATNRRVTILLLQNEALADLKPEYINEEDALDEETLNEKMNEAKIKKEGEFDSKKYNSTGSKIERAPTLEELRMKRAKEAFKKKHPNGFGSNQVGAGGGGGHGEAPKEEPAADHGGGGHGGGH